MTIEDLKTLLHLIKPNSGRDQKERLENFYSAQADSYDHFRQRLLPGREELIRKIEEIPGSSWADLGCGTGENLRFMGNACKKFSSITLLDLSPSLLQKAQKKAKELNINHVDFQLIDVHDWTPSHALDLITLSYSLTMIPRWPLVLEKALRYLKPGGHIAVVDFYVSSKFPLDGFTKHSGLQRFFWPLWFSWDNVFLSPDHLEWLTSHFNQKFRFEGETSLPFLPGLRVPYYLFLGQKSD